MNCITGDGTLGISIAAGTADDNTCNSAPAAGPSMTFTVDNTPPTVSIFAPPATLTNTGPITYTVTYSGANAVTLAPANITLNSSGTATGMISVSGMGTATREFCTLAPGAETLLQDAIDRVGFSAQTLAALDDSEAIRDNHVAEAIQYRNLDRQVL